MLHRLYTIDYGSTRAGSKPAAVEDEYHPVFFLDYISTIVRPMMPITRTSDRFSDNVTISFQHWQTPYSAKHLYDLLFHLERRTFRIATAATMDLNQPVFHAYDLGANIDMPVSESLRALQEVRQRPPDRQYSLDSDDGVPPARAHDLTLSDRPQCGGAWRSIGLQQAAASPPAPAGEPYPDIPDASRPFARGMQRFEQSIAEGKFAVRMEQIVSIYVSALTLWRKTFHRAAPHVPCAST
ncbi:hypothetical protein V501_05823 [Pseudogymnoascus sp. VKM F-4519 (FW-2642)]|nr:hypothetical protein V501_05823 [Pseudogymnoascus sp. VKM F-4519 (FW-2642)]